MFKLSLLTAFVLLQSEFVYKSWAAEEAKRHITVDEFIKETSAMKAEQPEARQELIKLFKHSKSLVAYMSKHTLPNEPLEKGEMGNLIWYARPDLHFDTALVFRNYKHLAGLAEFVGFVTSKDAAPAMLTNEGGGSEFFLTHELTEVLNTFEPEFTTHHYSLKLIRGKWYLVFVRNISATISDEAEHIDTQYVLIDNGKFTVERTKRKTIPLSRR